MFAVSVKQFDQIKQTFKENKEINVKKNIKKISA